ncbi:MAG: hypothetical protein KF823_03635 [Xanthomonadales bacterium]|nr:hypothetical protein [Xanthomonadales bacterium]
MSTRIAMHYGNSLARASRLALALFLGLITMTTQAGVLPDGDEFVVSNDTTFNKERTALAADAAGVYIAAWTSFNQDGSFLGVYARRFDAQGLPLGDEFQVNTDWDRHQSEPAVAVSADGSFVIVWESQQLIAGQVRWMIRGQRFASNGLPQGGEFQANAGTGSNHRRPTVAMAPDGAFVIAWESTSSDGGFGYFGQRYAADGTPLGGEFQYRSGGQTATAPSLAHLPDGGFLAVWPQWSGGQYAIEAQRFSASGSPQGGTIVISTASAQIKTAPRVVVNGHGAGLVIWRERPAGSQLNGIVARRLDASGQPASTIFQVHQFESQKQGMVPAIDAGGNALVVWASALQDGTPWSIYARHVPADGSLTSTEFRVNTTVVGSQFWPWVAMQPDGRAMVIWDNGDAPHRQQIHGQRLRSANLIFANGFETPPLLGNLAH